jgi:hypothetical protein
MGAARAESVLIVFIVLIILTVLIDLTVKTVRSDCQSDLIVFTSVIFIGYADDQDDQDYQAEGRFP